MDVFSKKFLFKPRFFWSAFFAAAVLAVVLFTVYFNFLLNNSLPVLEKKLSYLCGIELSVEKVKFVPFNRIVLYRVSSAEFSAQKTGFFAPRVSACYSFKKLLSEKTFSFSSLEIFAPELVVRGFDREKIKHIVRIAEDNKSGGLPVKIKVNQGLVNFFLKDGSFLRLQIDGLAFFDPVKGLEARTGIIWDKNENLSSRFLGKERLQCRFSLVPGRNGAELKNLEIENRNVYLKLWGDLEKTDLKLKGMVSSRPGLWKMNEPENDFLFKDKVSDLKACFKGKAAQVLNGKSSGFNIYDLDCHFRFFQKKTELVSAFFSWNGLPWRIKGEFVPAPVPRICFSGLSYPDQHPELRKSLPRKYDLYAEGAWEEDSFNCSLKLDFLRQTGKSLLPQSLVLDGSRVVVSPGPDKQIELGFASLLMEYHDCDCSYQVLAENVLSSFEPKKTDGFDFFIYFSVYGGRLESSGTVSWDPAQPLYSADLKLSGLAADSASHLIPGFTFSSGSLQAGLKLKADPLPQVAGEVEIRQGCLENMQFLQWLSGFSSIPSLAELNFSRFYFHFLANEQKSAIDKISIESQPLSLTGDFDLYPSQLVSGNISLGFSRTLLELSPKFRKLCKLLKDEDLSVNFDFRLSGLYEAMNFKWLASDFKHDLQKILPGSMEKSMEKKIEAVITSISDRK